MKTNTKHERKRTEFNMACEDLACANCGQPRVAGSTLCKGCLPVDGVYRFRQWHVPAHMMLSIQRYIHKKIKPGDFLTAVICNNLSEAVGRADAENLLNLPAFASFFYNESPLICWGSKNKMNAWLKAEE